MITATIELDGTTLTLSTAEAISKGAPVHISQDCRARVEAARDVVARAAAGDKPVYGVNTGFGYLAHERIGSEQLSELQHNILVSHASGYGTPLPDGIARLAMALRLHVLLKGCTGVRWELCERLYTLLDAGICPLIPRYGSVGASGDLAPLAHLALPVIGEGRVRYQGEEMSASEALTKLGLSPLRLVEKEGLGLINGTQVMLAVGSPALAQARRLSFLADKVAALTLEALGGRARLLHAGLHEARGHHGQRASAQRIRDELEGYDRKATGRVARVQDPYSIRCAPQVHGASADFIEHCCRVVEQELNAATDNPLVFAETEEIVSGGNFHGQYLAISYDTAAMAVSELGNISDRRTELLLNPTMSKLPAFLTPNPGVNSGYMAVQYLTASMVNENKILSHPACTDSIPGNVGVEDHVSMGMTSAHKLTQIVDNVWTILAVELLASAQALDLEERQPMAVGTSESYAILRSHVPTLGQDRLVANDVAGARGALEEIAKNVPY